MSNYEQFKPYITESSNFSGLSNIETARTNLGLGTAATLNTGSNSGDIPTVSVVDSRIAAYVAGGNSTGDEFYDSFFYSLL